VQSTVHARAAFMASKYNTLNGFVWTIKAIRRSSF